MTHPADPSQSRRPTRRSSTSWRGRRRIVVDSPSPLQPLSGPWWYACDPIDHDRRTGGARRVSQDVLLRDLYEGAVAPAPALFDGIDLSPLPSALRRGLAALVTLDWWLRDLSWEPSLGLLYDYASGWVQLSDRRASLLLVGALDGRLWTVDELAMARLVAPWLAGGRGEHPLRAALARVEEERNAAGRPWRSPFAALALAERRLNDQWQGPWLRDAFCCAVLGAAMREQR